MSGWLDWFEDEITCPNCGFKFFVLFCEDVDISTNPPIVKCFVVDEYLICSNFRNINNENNLLDDA